jgi:uncharacterized protein (TIGR03118 family)
MFKSLLATLSLGTRSRELHKRKGHFARRRSCESILHVEALEARTLMSATPNSVYLQTNLISDQAGVAAITDASLVNAWGLAVPPTGGNFWISDNGTGLSSVYGGDVNQSDLTKKLADVTIPGEGPTGVVFNPFSMSNPTDFVISSGTSSGPAAFIFVTEDGTIAGWNANVPPGPPPSSQAQVGTTVAGAIYKGVAIGNNGTENLLYAANFHTGHIDVFDRTFASKTLAGNFTDPDLPMGYAPFNVQNIGGTLYVMYAQQDANAEDEVAGAGKGFVDKFDLNGHLLGRFASSGVLNAPWGIAQAPANFGKFSGDILVGNFGDGRINAFTTAGTFAGTLKDVRGNPIAIDGLWALAFGNGISAGEANNLYFTAGPDEEMHGLFGKLAPAVNLTQQTVISGPAHKTIDFKNGHFTGSLILHNHSKTELTGPITIIFDRLPAGVTIDNATGLDANGNPFITLTDVTIAPHKKVQVPVEFSSMSHNLGRIIVGLHRAAVVQGELESSSSAVQGSVVTPVSKFANHFAGASSDKTSKGANGNIRADEAHGAVAHAMVGSRRMKGVHLSVVRAVNR